RPVAPPGPGGAARTGLATKAPSRLYGSTFPHGVKGERSTREPGTRRCGGRTTMARPGKPLSRTARTGRPGLGPGPLRRRASAARPGHGLALATAARPRVRPQTGLPSGPPGGKAGRPLIVALGGSRVAMGFRPDLLT